MARSRLRRIVDLLRRTPLHPQWLLGTGNTVVGQLQALGPGRVLDIGCADRWVERALPKGCDYIGVDYFATGKLMYGARPDVFADASRLPLADASVDAVTIFEVVEHLRHPREALQEIARVLRPQGRLMLTMPFLYPIHDAPHDYQRYTVHGLTREIEMAGLRIENIEPSLGSSETAGLVANLALGGMGMEAIRRRNPAVLLVPLIALAIPAINLVTWLGGRLLPSWPAVTAGYTLTASKP